MKANIFGEHPQYSIRKINREAPQNTSQMCHVAAVKVKWQAIYYLGKSTLAHTFNQPQDGINEGVKYNKAQKLSVYPETVFLYFETVLPKWCQM